MDDSPRVITSIKRKQPTSAVGPSTATTALPDSEVQSPTPVVSTDQRIKPRQRRCRQCLDAGGDRASNAHRCRGAARPRLCNPDKLLPYPTAPDGNAELRSPAFELEASTSNTSLESPQIATPPPSDVHPVQLVQQYATSIEYGPDNSVLVCTACFSSGGQFAPNAVYCLGRSDLALCRVATALAQVPQRRQKRKAKAVVREPEVAAAPPAEATVEERVPASEADSIAVDPVGVPAAQDEPELPPPTAPLTDTPETPEPITAAALLPTINAANRRRSGLANFMFSNRARQFLPARRSLPPPAQAEESTSTPSRPASRSRDASLSAVDGGDAQDVALVAASASTSLAAPASRSAQPAPVLTATHPPSANPSPSSSLTTTPSPTLSTDAQRKTTDTLHTASWTGLEHLVAPRASMAPTLLSALSPARARERLSDRTNDID